MKQKGFATLEVILMIVVIAILASIAVPRFSEVSAKANTAKIQADLSTIDTAIAVYQLEKGEDPANIAALVTAGYLQDTPKPPEGYAYVDGTKTKFSAGNYDIVAKSGNVEAHAVLGTNKASDFSLTKNSSGNSGGSSGNGSSGGGTGQTIGF